MKGQNTGTIDKDHTALLIIDVQKFYFPEGQLPLKHPKKTSQQIKKVLDAFRKDQMEVIHIKHNVNKNAGIYKLLKPLENEKVITKNEANGFNGTELNEYLKNTNIKSLVITGMQTHMCVEATTRAAYDLGYKCTVISDGCTTKNIKFRNHTIKAKDVHFSTLSTIQNSYGKVLTADEFVKKIE
jgi:nicotinamidase-related amidase